MGCFRSCFGGGGERRKSRARSPVAVKAGASPPLPEPTDLAPPPLPEPADLAPPPPPVEVAAVSPESKDHRQLSEHKESPVPSLPQEKIVTPTLSPVSTSPRRELRQLSEGEESPAPSLPQEKIVTPSLSPVKCSHVAAAVVSAPDMEPRDISEEGTVGSHWSSTKQADDSSSSRSYSGSTGIPNTTSKYREDKRVTWHTTPFSVRVEKVLKKYSTSVAAKER